MGDRLLLFRWRNAASTSALTMQRIFDRRSLADALDGQGLAGRGCAREPSSRENGFHPLHSARGPDQMPGSATTRAGVLRPASASISSCWI
jgi:hypothetical protein